MREHAKYQFESVIATEDGGPYIGIFHWKDNGKEVRMVLFFLEIKKS